MPYQKRTLWRVGERWISNVILHISREKKWQSLFNPWLITKSTMMASCFGNPTLFSLPFPLLMWSLRLKLHHGNHESTTKVHQNTAARNLPNLPWIFHYLLEIQVRAFTSGRLVPEMTVGNKVRRKQKAVGRAESKNYHKGRRRRFTGCCGCSYSEAGFPEKKQSGPCCFFPSLHGSEDKMVGAMAAISQPWSKQYGDKRSIS